MSNNRFLKPKEQNRSKEPNRPKEQNRPKESNRPKEPNTRFQFLDKEDISTDTTKKEKIISTYDSSSNSFTKSTNNFERPRNVECANNFERPRNTRRDDNRSSSNFKPKESVKVPEIILTPELFPELIPNSNNSSDNVSNATNFKDILNTKIEPEIDPNRNLVTPGFVEITVVNNKFIMKHGPPTRSEIKMNARLERENNINFCMNNVIVALATQWTKYKEDYDNLNGDGSYDELYCLPPVYGPEYDIEEEETNDEQIHNESDYVYDYSEQ